MKRKHTFWRSGTLQMLAVIVIPLTVLLMVVAVGSVALHQQVMRSQLPEEEVQAATNPALELTLLAPLVLIAPLLFSIAALWFGNRQIIQPLQKLESKAAALAWGDFETIHEPVGGISEIRHLQKELAEMSRRVQAAQDGLHDYIGAITSAQEEERNRLARELHDDTIQAVIALKQRLQLAQKTFASQGARKALDELETMAGETVENLRRLTRALRPIYLEDLGLVTALEMLTREMEQEGSMDIAFIKQGHEQRLAGDVELVLYRIAQEALHNVLRHSGAKHAALSISFSPEEISLEVRDDGVGFQVPSSPTDLAPNGHYGLLGMRERANLIGARFEVMSESGKGTIILVRISSPFGGNTM